MALDANSLKQYLLSLNTLLKVNQSNSATDSVNPKRTHGGTLGGNNTGTGIKSDPNDTISLYKLVEVVATDLGLGAGGSVQTLAYNTLTYDLSISGGNSVSLATLVGSTTLDDAILQSNDAIGDGGVAITAARSDHKHIAQTVSADAGQILKDGTDGLAFFELAIIAATTISPASDDAIGLLGTSVLFAKEDHKHPAQGVSTDLNNGLSVGTDGLHWLDANTLSLFQSDQTLTANRSHTGGGFNFQISGLQDFRLNGVANEFFVGTPNSNQIAVNTGGIILNSAGGTLAIPQNVLTGGTGGTLSLANQLIGAAFVLPSDNGTANQYLITDGSGNTSWTTPAVDVSIYSADGVLAGNRAFTGGGFSLTQTGFSSIAMNATGAVTLTGAGIATVGSSAANTQIQANGTVYQWPTVDGTVGQTIATDGAGNLSFVSGTNNIYTTDGTLTGARTVAGGGNSLTMAGFSSFSNGSSGTYDTIAVGKMTHTSLNEIDLQAPTLTLKSNVWPLSDGTAGQVITTDGAGTLSWSSAGSNIYASDGVLTGNRQVTGSGNNMTFIGQSNFTVNGTNDIILTTGNVATMEGTVYSEMSSGASFFKADAGELTMFAGGAFGNITYNPTGLNIPSSTQIKFSDNTNAVGSGTHNITAGVTGVAIQSDGNIVTTGGSGGTWTMSVASDRRIKENIISMPIGDSYKILDAINAYRFDYIKETAFSANGRQIGAMAQDLIEIAPEVVRGSEEEMYYLEYQNLVPVLAEIIKDQKSKIESLEARLIAIETLLK